MGIKDSNSKFLEQSLFPFSLCLHNSIIGQQIKVFPFFKKHEAENCLKSKKHIKKHA